MSEHLDLDRAASSEARGSVQPRATTASFGARVSGDHEVQLIDYVKVLYKRRRVAITAFLLVLVAAAVYTFTATPIYEARVQLLIEAENPNVVSFKEVIEQEKATNDYYQTQYKILQSRTLARRTLDTLKLWDRFDATKAPKRVTVGSAIGAVVAPIAGLVKPAKKVQAPDAGETAAESRILDAFLDNLTIVPIRNSRLVDVQYESPDADLAAGVANGLAHAYIEQSLEFKYTSSKEASDWLGQRLGEQRRAAKERRSRL